MLGKEVATHSGIFAWEYACKIPRTDGLQSLAHSLRTYVSFPGGSDGKESVCKAGDLASIPESRRSPREGKGNPLQYSCLENPMDRGSWLATADEFAKSWRTN